MTRLEELNIQFNKELFDKTPTHRFNGRLVKIYPSTHFGNTVTGEILEGEHKGKLTTVYLDKAEELKK